MGREIRRVPPNWEHPKDDRGKYQPQMDSNYLESLNEWIENHRKWEAGEDKDREESGCRFFAEWHGEPPSVAYYCNYTSSEATWYQLYENVSEGTPLSPPFETPEELVEWLSINPDFWDTQWSRKGAEGIVKSGYQPSFMIGGGTGIMGGNDLAEFIADKETEEPE